MPSNFKANDPNVNEQVDLDDIFINDAWLVDQFVGGTLFSCGYNDKGQLGNGTTTNYSSPIQIGSLTNWKQIAANVQRHIAAVKTDGTLWACGYNNAGQLGNGTSLNRYSSPIQIGSLTNWKQVAVSQNMTMMVKTDGTLWGCGYNQWGELGNGTQTKYNSPIQIGTLNNWKQVSCGGNSSAAVKNDGTLWTWGYNRSGQLGNGTGVYYSSPIQVGSLTNWKQVVCGYNGNMFAIKTDGTLWGCGYNYAGILGLGEHPSTAVYSTGSISPPKKVTGASSWANTDPDTTILFNSGSGGLTTFAIGSDNSLWGWGRNNIHGTLGNGTSIWYSSPIQIGSLTNWKQVSTSFYTNNGMHTMAVKTDGTLWGWGYNIYGALGNGTASNDYTSPIQVGSLTDWKQVSCGGTFTIAVKTDGTLWAWGYNHYGYLGNGENYFTNSKSSPVQIGSLTNWSKVACGYGYTMAVKTNGTLWTWGTDTQSGAPCGQLGLGVTGVYYSSPVQVGSLTNWKQVSISSGYSHVAAVKTDGTLWTWGYNAAGQLGNGTSQSYPGGYSSPIQVGSLTSWKQVSNGAQHTIAVKTDGTLWGWGDDSYGQLGGIGSKSSPVQIGTANNWSQVTCSYNTTHAYTTDGNLYAFGRSNAGQAGAPSNYSGNISSPIQIGSLSDWKQISAGAVQTAAIKTNGTLWTWGYNPYGQLGNQTTDNYSSPIQIGTSTTWKQVSAGYSEMRAIKTDGTLWAWGSNEYGQLGNGTITNYSSPIQVGLLSNWKSVSSGNRSIFGITFKDLG